MSKEFYIGMGRKETWPNITGASPMSLTFDNVLLQQNNSEIESRSQVDLSVEFGPYLLSLPVISAPMDTVTGEVMARELARLGGIGAIPRGKNMDESLRICEALSDDNIPAVYAVGLKNGFEHAKLLKERGAEILLVDVANGAQKGVKELAHEIKNKLDVTIMAGNITTYDVAKEYKNYGIDIARVGVGGGGLCTTRMKTGVGAPQLSAIFDTSVSGIYVVADGGIHHPGDAAKAFAAGARMVMIGSMFGGTDETPGEVQIVNGQRKKEIRGQASKNFMDDNNIYPSEHRTAEGIATLVDAIGPVADVIQDIKGGIKSGFSYIGAATLDEFQQKAQFIVISDATQKENSPHIVLDRK